MSYALRNTLILLSTLLLLVVGGWAYMKWGVDQEIEAYERVITQRQREITTSKAKADGFDTVREAYIRTVYRQQNYNKELFDNSNVADIYEFIRRLNDGPASLSMNFSLVDSMSTKADHGHITVQLDGSGAYRNFYHFINRLEQSRPIAKIIKMQVQPQTELDKLQDVVFAVTVRFYYRRGTTLTGSSRAILAGLPQLRHNPLTPLITAIPSNVDGLTNTEASRLIAVTARSAYVIDQEGRMVHIDIGDRVYLGFLERISQNAGTATFRLNKGGIEDIVTLRIGQPTNPANSSP